MKIKIHIHIPKTGGKSMIKMFQAKYKTLCVYTTWQPDRYIFSEDADALTLDQLLKEDKSVLISTAFYFAKQNDFEAIIGNISIPQVDAVARRFWDDIEYSAIIRQPFDRAFSERCHDTQYYDLPPDDDSFYERKANFMTRQIGSLDNLSFVGDFDHFDEAIRRLGLEEVHENKSEGRRLLFRNDFDIERCNQLDLKLYNQMKYLLKK